MHYFGIPNYGVREISKIRKDKGKLSTIFKELFLINFASTTIIALLYYLVITVLNINNKPLYYIEGIILILNIFNVDWFYQGMEEFKYITIRSAFIKILSIIAIFLFIKTKSHIYIYALIFAFAYVGNYTLNIINLRKYINFSNVKVNKKKHLKSIFILAVTYISNEIYVTVDTLMLGVMNGDYQVGLYSNAMKLIKILINLLTAIGVALLPRISFLKSKNEEEKLKKIINKTIHILFFITVPAVIGIIFISKELIVVLFGEKFVNAQYILIALALLIVLRTFSNLFLQMLISSHKDKNTSKVYFYGMVMNVILNYFMIKKYLAVGAAISSVIAEGYIMIMLMVSAKKDFKFELKKRIILSIVISSIMMLIPMCIVYSLNLKMIIKLGLSIMLGIVTYIVSNILMKNEIIFEGIKLLKRRK